MFKATFFIAAKASKQTHKQTTWESPNVHQLMNKHDIQTKECHISIRWILKVYTCNPSMPKAGEL